MLSLVATLSKKSSNVQALPLAAALLVCTVGTIYWKTTTTRAISQGALSLSEDGEKNDEIIAVELLPIEKVMASGGAGDNAIGTLTWFHGDYSQVVEGLEQRALEILQANPWLGGRVQKHSLLGGENGLIYKKTFDPKNIGDHFVCLTDTVASQLLSRDIPLEQLGTKLSHLLMKYGPKEPLWKVYIIPCSKFPKEKFAVIFNMSHAIADGATYYAIHNMFLKWNKATTITDTANTKDNDSGGEPIRSLNCKRIMSTGKQQILALGGEAEYKILQSAGFIVNCILGVIYSKFTRQKSLSRIFMVDAKGMEMAKQAAVNPSSSLSSSGDRQVPFVSTNDVLTSWFLQNSNSLYGLMAINLRGKLEGHTDAHAGNYQSVIFYQQQDSASPTLIRKSISQPKQETSEKISTITATASSTTYTTTTNANDSATQQAVVPLFKRQITMEEPMPTFRQMSTGSFAIVSNWASFSKPCSIPGCQEDIHMPLYNVESAIPSTLVICIFFRSGPKGLAVFVAGSPDKVANIEKEYPLFLSKDKTLL